ncbi:MAG: HNH endonuclease [Bacteroidetes bacterium]|nr:MAG: HNH endonuclease [Bacteroidota bacterium]
MANNLWTRDELILAFNLYLKIPFGKNDHNNRDVIELAHLIGRTPNSISIRLSNFASIDPYHQNRGVKGMSGGSKQCQPIWDEFIEHKEALLFESERILAEKQQVPLETKFADILIGTENLRGEMKVREVKTRVNQQVFRRMILSAYSVKCAITDIDIPDLLVASHIIPWAANEQERLNPENGICLSAFYDKAFDKGYIGINEKYEVMLSPALNTKEKQPYYASHFGQISGRKIRLPGKWHPNKSFLQAHLDTVFIR